MTEDRGGGRVSESVRVHGNAVLADRVDVENVSHQKSVVEALWALGAPGPKKRLKRSRRAGWGVVERVLKTAPKGVVFCRLFTGTETYPGYFGLVPTAAQVGDLVCLLLGGDAPVVLRRDEADGLYIYIGDCYVHGIMYGEVRKLFLT
jgi:hypothetical protein